MRKFLFTLLLAVSGTALPLQTGAAENCKLSATRNLTLDLGGVRSVVVETGPFDFHVRAGNAARVTGRACATTQQDLDRLQLAQRREGDRLILGPAKQAGSGNGGGWFGSRETRLDVDVTLPAGTALDMRVGSGDGDVTGIASVDAKVGSGDLRVQAAQRLQADVGSGDLQAEDIGQLQLGSVGSGDVEARRIRGGVHIDTVGSGDVQLHQVGGNVEVRSIGSGDLSIATAGGDLTVGHVGSGDVDYRDIKGRVDVPRND